MLHKLFRNKMLHITDVGSKGKENGYNITPETGIFVTLSPTKTYSKNNYVSMFQRNCSTSLLSMLLVFLLCCQQQCLASIEETTTVATDNKGVIFNETAPAYYECNAMDLRHNCRDFHKLHNCTVVTGFLTLAYYYGPTEDCFETYKFVNLREITDFFLISHLSEFSSIKEMFPSLTVIRGRRLFRNYALMFSDYTALEKVEFKSLIAIQRGHVLIQGSKNLCYTEKINWDRLTLGKGKNNIYHYSESNCTEKASCRGCKRDACWSNDVCQKFEDDSVISPTQDPKKDCHEECLGGCYNPTAQGCVVCKNYTDHGTCVSKCPLDKYSCSAYLRCYTREECVRDKELFILNNTCVADCPIGYNLNNETRHCEPCDKNNTNCRRMCSSQSRFENIIYITDIAAAESIEYCQIVNGSLVIDMYENFDPAELKALLKNIVEITDFLKINRSPYLTSLDFLENLEKIHGQNLESNHFSVIIYNNIRLSELWRLKPGFEMVKGGMYIYANDKLCNRHIKEFRRAAKHDRSLDSIQQTDQEVLCSPATLNLRVEVLSHRSVKLIWSKIETSTQVEIAYKPLAENERITEKSELDPNVCNRIKWHRELKFFDELESDYIYYNYIIKDLEPRTRYAVLVKTFSGDDDTQEARSEIKYIITKFDIPKAPRLTVKSKTSDSLQIEFFPDSTDSYFTLVEYYNLVVYHMPDDEHALDKRNYCDEPAKEFIEKPYENYETCCSRLKKENQEKQFLTQLRKEFSCSLDRKEYCEENINAKTTRKPLHMERFDVQQINYNIKGLNSFQLYVLQMQACNHVGCSNYNMLSARTNYSLTADKVTGLSICKLAENNEYRFEFRKPKQRNGYITSYLFYMRNSNNSIPFYFRCLKRSQLESNNYIFHAKTNHTLIQGAVKAMSLGHYHSSPEWVDITLCTKMAGQVWTYYLIGLFVTLLACCITWLCYSRNRWRRIPALLRFYVPVHTGWRYIRPAAYVTEDNLHLVEGSDILSARSIEDIRQIELQELHQNPQ